MEKGIGYESFDEAFPHSEWEQIDFFDNPRGDNFTLWARRNRRSNNRPAFSVQHWDEPGLPVHWMLVNRGPLSVVRESFATLKAAEGKKRVKPKPRPAPEPDPILSHPNYGRF